jgi:hypothetical protein
MDEVLKFCVNNNFKDLKTLLNKNKNLDINHMVSNI